MTKKSPGKKSEHQGTSLGIHQTISDSQKLIEEKEDNSNWWLFLLILMIFGFVFIYLLGNGNLRAPQL